MVLIVSVILSFIGMELVSWLIHRYIMHGPLWNIHKTHHQHTNGWLELNDVFTIFFGGLAVILLVVGLEQNKAIFTGAGTGITLYGLTYFVVHDVLIHRRIRLDRTRLGRSRLFGRVKHPLLKALSEAHQDHHKSRERDGSTSFGLLLIDFKYIRKHFKQGRKS